MTRRLVDLPSRVAESPQFVQDIISYNGFTEREADIVAMLHDVGKTDVTFDIKHSASRTIKAVCREKQITTCVLPTSKLLLCQRPLPRVMTGVECLALQGIGHSLTLDSEMPDSLLLSLAGNAFSAAPCAAVLLSAFITLPLPEVDD